MEDDIIEKLFEKKEDDDLFNFDSDEIKKWQRLQAKDSQELYEFISKRVHPKSQSKLQNLIEKYINSIIEELVCTEKLYYRSGFLDGLSLSKISNNK